MTTTLRVLPCVLVFSVVAAQNASAEPEWILDERVQRGAEGLSSYRQVDVSGTPESTATAIANWEKYFNSYGQDFSATSRGKQLQAAETALLRAMKAFAQAQVATLAAFPGAEEAKLRAGDAAIESARQTLAAVRKEQAQAIAGQGYERIFESVGINLEEYAKSYATSKAIVAGRAAVTKATTAFDAALSAATGDEANSRAAEAAGLELSAACTALQDNEAKKHFKALDGADASAQELEGRDRNSRGKPKKAGGGGETGGCAGVKRKLELLNNLLPAENNYGSKLVALQKSGGTEADVAEARALFLSAHPTRFLFLARDTSSEIRDLKRGEAVLAARGERDNDAVIITGDGVRLLVPRDWLSMKPIPRAKLHGYQASTMQVFVDDREGKRVTVWPDYPVTDPVPVRREMEFLRVMDVADVGYEKYTKAADKFFACFDAQWKKLDPDGRAGHYDQETVNVRTGEVVKVESLSKAIERKACAACGCGAMWKLANATSTKVFAADRKKAFEALAPVSERLTKLFGR